MRCNVLVERMLLLCLCWMIFPSCKHHDGLSLEAQKVQAYMVNNAVVAHRGTMHWAPELTEAAYRWARNTGADYLELDVRYAKDGALVLVRDTTLERTTDVSIKFPGREKDVITSFTYEEILHLDAGSWFNEKYPEYARESFVGQDVLVLEDVFRIAEGKRIKRDADGKRIVHKDETGEYIFEYEEDPLDNGNRPGVYIDIKPSAACPGIEKDIYELLTRIGWNILEGQPVDNDMPFYVRGKVNICNTSGKVLIQSFSRSCIATVHELFRGQILCSLLVEAKDDDDARPDSFDEMISFAKANGAQFIGAKIGEGAKDGLPPSFARKIREAGLKTNIFAVNTEEQMVKYFGVKTGKRAQPLMDGTITNRADLVLDFYHTKGLREAGKEGGMPQEVLIMLGY